VDNDNQDFIDGGKDVCPLVENFALRFKYTTPTKLPPPFLLCMRNTTGFINVTGPIEILKNTL